MGGVKDRVYHEIRTMIINQTCNSLPHSDEGNYHGQFAQVPNIAVAYPGFEVGGADSTIIGACTNFGHAH